MQITGLNLKGSSRRTNGVPRTNRYERISGDNYMLFKQEEKSIFYPLSAEEYYITPINVIGYDLLLICGYNEPNIARVIEPISGVQIEEYSEDYEEIIASLKSYIRLIRGEYALNKAIDQHVALNGCSPAFRILAPSFIPSRRPN